MEGSSWRFVRVARVGFRRPARPKVDPRRRALRVIEDMREVAELCNGDTCETWRAQLVLNTLATVERRINEAG